MKLLKGLSSVFLIAFFSLWAIKGDSTDFQFTYTLDEKGEIINPSITDDETIVKIKKGEQTPFPNPKIAEDFFKQKKANPDTIGWLSIPQMGYYPVFFNGDNQYYLNHDKDKKFDYAGSIFMNKFSDGRFENTCLLHGHRMKDSTMFGSLGKFEDPKFFQENKLIEVFDGKYLYYYKPFSIFRLKDGEEFLNQEKEDYEDPRRIAYMKSLYKRSLVKMQDGMEPDFKSQVLYLSTCDYAFEEARLVLVSSLLKKVPYEMDEEKELLLNTNNELYDIFSIK